MSRVLDTAYLFPPEHTEPAISYGEVWSVLGFWWFAERAVDIAVVEVGAGGRFDATNVIDPILSVVTSVGLDHLVTLGPAIADIAWHKAGIIKPGSSVVIGELPWKAIAVIAEEAEKASADLIRAGSLGASLSHWSRCHGIPAGECRRGARWSAHRADSGFRRRRSPRNRIGAAPRTIGVDARDGQSACLDRWCTQPGQVTCRHPRGHPSIQ